MTDESKLSARKRGNFFYLTELDFKLAVLIGKDVVWNAQQYIDDEPTSSWVFTRSPSPEECQAKIDAWSPSIGEYKPLGVADRQWSPSTSLDDMAEVEHELLRIRKTKRYARTLIKKLDMDQWMDGGFILATAPARLRAEAALEILERFGRPDRLEEPDYSKEIPEYADVMTKEDFIGQVIEVGTFNEYDGTGYPVKDGKMATNSYVFPLSRIPEDATHIAWFNK